MPITSTTKGATSIRTRASKSLSGLAEKKALQRKREDQSLRREVYGAFRSQVQEHTLDLNEWEGDKICHHLNAVLERVERSFGDRRD